MRAQLLSTCLLIGFGLTLGPAVCVGAPARSDEGDVAHGPDEQSQQADDESVARPVPAEGVIPYVIVTDRSLLPEFRRLAHAHSHAGLLATVRTVQGIHAAYPSGHDDAERIRMFLKDAHANWGTEWVLLGGDDPLVPVRRAYVRAGVSILGSIQLPTDQYYACLGGTWNADGDSLWGELPYDFLGEPGDSVDFVPVLSVGRAPVTTREEARVFVEKTLHELDAREAQAPLSVLLAASQSLVDFAILTERLVPLVANDPATHVARLYQNWTQWPGSFEETRASLLDSLDRGYDLVVLAGPGGPGIFAAGLEPREDLAAGDLLDLTNRRPPSHIVAMSAYTSKPGILSIGTALMRAPHGGAVTVLGCTDNQLVNAGYSLASEFFRQAYAADAPTIGEALKRAIVAIDVGFTVTDFWRLTSQGYMLLGDPALTLPGVPVVAAQSRRGAMRGAAGELATGAAGLALGAAYPNPASTEARLEFTLPPSSEHTRLEVAVLDVAGRLVRVLERRVAHSGPGGVTWDLRDETGTRVREGLYFIRVAAGSEMRVTRIAVLH